MDICLRTRSRLSLLAVGLLLSVLLAACGSSSSSTPTANSAAAATTPALATTAATRSTPVSAGNVATPEATPDEDSEYGDAGATTVKVRSDPMLGEFLTTEDGLTLYIYTKDTSGKSVCNDKCAANWPPLIASGTPTAPSEVTGTLSTIMRDDGSSQLAYNGMPLYTFIKDKAAGDTTGQEVGGVWFVATVAGTPATPVAGTSGTPAASATTVLVHDDATLGKILTTASGMTLYTYTKDTPGKSVCNGTCATNWPPLSVDGTPTAPAGVSGTLGTITRDDGSTQITYNDKPLYTFIKDKAAGDTTGQKVGGVWFVATP